VFSLSKKKLKLNLNSRLVVIFVLRLAKPLSESWSHAVHCALSVRPLLSADLSPSTGCYKLILLTLYGAPTAAMQ